MTKEKEKANPEAKPGAKPGLQSPAEEAVIDTVTAADPAPAAAQQTAATINTGGTADSPQRCPEKIWAQIIKANTNQDIESITTHHPVSGDALELELVPQEYRDMEARDEMNTPGNMKMISFMAESLKVLESESGKTDGEYVDIEVSILSTQITLNGTQYTLDDLKSNAARLNAGGGLIFAMGTHDFDATSNVGIGKTFLDETQEMLKAKARIYNTSTYPDMVRRIRLGLVRDVSIEGTGKTYKKQCHKNNCWIKVFGLIIKRATFVWAGADERAKITKVLESLAGHNELNEYDRYDKTEKVNNLKEQQIEPTGTDPKETSDTVATAETKEAEAKASVEAEAQETNTTTGTETGTEAKEAEVKKAPDQDVKAVSKEIMAVCNEMKKIVSDIKDMMKGMTDSGDKEAVQQKETAPSAVTGSVKTEAEEEKPPRVKESLATPGSASSNFYEQVKGLVQ